MFYDDDSQVGFVTELLRKQGRNILQIFQKPTEQEQADYLLERFQPVGSTVLDVGCGTGEVSRLMKNRRPDLDFILLNISPSQLRLCPSGMSQLLGDAHQIPLDDNSVDNVMACYVMGHLKKEQALKEFNRVVKPGGVIFLYELTGGEMPELEYTAHSYDNSEDVSNEVNCNRFMELMPDFKNKFPDIKPIVVRMTT